MKIMLVGGHQKINFLVKSLKAKRHSVVVVNDDYEWCEFLSHTHKVTIVHGDGTKPFILEDAGAADMDTIIALSNVDATNLIVCLIAKKKFNVKNTIAIVNNPKNLQVFKRLGVSKCISSTQMLTNVIEQEAVIEDLVSYLAIDEGKVAVYEMELHSGSPAINKKLKDLALPEDCVIGYVVRDTSTFVARGNTKLYAGDTIVVLSSTSAIERVAKLISGNKQTRRRRI